MNDVSSEEIGATVSGATGTSPVDVDGSGISILGVWGRGWIEILGLTSTTEFVALFISSSGISSERGLGMRGLPSRDRARLPEESRDRLLGVLEIIRFIQVVENNEQNIRGGRDFYQRI